MTGIELKAVREHIYQLDDYVPAMDRWRIERLKGDIDTLLAYVQRLERQVTEAQDVAFHRRLEAI